MAVFIGWNCVSSDLCCNNSHGRGVVQKFWPKLYSVHFEMHISWTWWVDIHHWTLLGQSASVYKKSSHNKNHAWNGDAILSLASTSADCTGIWNLVGALSWLLSSYNYFDNDIYMYHFISCNQVTWSCEIFFWIAL